MKIDSNLISKTIESLISQGADITLGQAHLDNATSNLLNQSDSLVGVSLQLHEYIGLQSAIYAQAIRIELLSKTAEAAASSVRRLSQGNQ